VIFKKGILSTYIHPYNSNWPNILINIESKN